MTFSKLNEIANVVSANENRNDERSNDCVFQLQTSLYEFGVLLPNGNLKEQYKNLVDCIPMIHQKEVPTYVSQMENQFMEFEVEKKENAKVL